nr:hypothetical protein [Tanacetum cinerariifolium]
MMSNSLLITNSLTNEIPHLYIRPPKVEARIIPGPVGILQKGVGAKKADVQAGGRDNILTTQDKEKLELVVGVLKSCTPNSLGDMIVTLKDPTGIVYAVTSRHTQM